MADTTDLTITITQEQPDLTITSDLPIDVNDSSDISFSSTQPIQILSEPVYHSSLNGLDYESSGHTGFASQKEMYADYANSLKISQVASTGVVIICLLNKKNEIIDTKTLDLDTEHIIKSAKLDYLNKKLIFILQNGTAIDCDISALIDTLTNKVEAEVNRATAAESSLKTLISNETVNARKAEAQLQTNITAEETRAKAQEATLQANITAEAATRTADDAILQKNIDAETSLRQSADKTLQTNITAEKTRAYAAEVKLSDSLDYESDRAKAAEDVLTNALAKEVSRATSAESSLTAALKTESERAVAKETDLSAKIVAETERANKADAELLSKINVEALTRSNEDTRVLKEAKAYTDTYGGKIDKIYVNDEVQPIVNKKVYLTVPTKESELVNDDNTVKDADYKHITVTEHEVTDGEHIYTYDDTELVAKVTAETDRAKLAESALTTEVAAVGESVTALNTKKAESLYYDATGELDPDGENNPYWYMSYDINNCNKSTLLKDASGNYVPLDLGAGGGGGSSIDITLTQVSWPTVISAGSDCDITVNWIAKRDEKQVSGTGNLIVRVNDVVVASKYNASQGNVTFSIGDYLTKEENLVNVTATFRDASNETANTIRTVELYLESTFDGSKPYTGEISYNYTPYGKITKTTHFIVDGKQVGTQEVRTTGDQQTYLFNGWTHGSHTLEVYFDAAVSGATVRSKNTLNYDIIYYVKGKTDAIIASTFDSLEQEQYISFNIPYRVYTPDHEYSSVTLSVTNTSGEVVYTKEVTVNQEEQNWEYAASDAGTFTFTIASGTASRSYLINIAESTIPVEPVTANLKLALSSVGRSNSEPNPEIWNDEEHGIECTLSNFNFTSDGWVKDDDNNTVLRVSADARVEIPYKPFEKDFRSTGKTIEIEFATRDVRNYDSKIISCFIDNIGFYITSQVGLIKSLQSELKTQFKEEEHVRLSFVVEKLVETHLILMYINGVMSGAVQYPEDDNFRQGTPVNITIGTNESTVDIYNIRIYDNNLTRKQIVSNWIADTQSAELKKKRYLHNDNYNDAGEIVIEKLPDDLPYMVYNIETLPTYKGDKRTADLITYVDPVDGSNSFTALKASMNVQGTSSQYYFRKNFKINFKGGFTQDGVTNSKYAIQPGAIKEKEFTFKADVASSEGANNVELVKYYEDTKPWTSPAQVMNSKCRVGIYGFPHVSFHQPTAESDSIYFYGKMNFNNDKGNKDTYGFTTNYDETTSAYLGGDESWEMTNNNTDLDLFKSDDLQSMIEVEGEMVPRWTTAFESRYPDDNTPDEHTFGYNDGEIDRLQDMVSWVYSTYRKDTDTEEEKAAKLKKFKDELEQRFDLESTLFYYLYTELFLLVDSRAKNAFPTYMKKRLKADGTYTDGDKWYWFPYDMDTAIGINNEGLLEFSYNLEDTDTQEGAYIYNGQESVMWNNVRDAYQTELRTMYENLRSGNAGGKYAWTYDIIEKRFEDHQDKWSETIFNEDAYSKYLTPLIQSKDTSYLGMLQGSKEEQRKWWLYNRFNYIDSKYKTGNALASTIMMRAYQKSNFHITPYADIYLTGNFDDQVVSLRANKDVEYELKSPESWDPHGTDAVVSLYSANQLKEIGDLSQFYIGYANFSAATKLQKIILGSSAEGYSNEKLTEVNVGANNMLQYLDVRNCPNLTQAVDLSSCTGIEEAYFDNTAISSVKLPNGGVLKILHLPETLTNLTIRNQKALTDLTIVGTSNLRRLWLENIPSSVIDAFGLISEMPAGAAIRLVGFVQNVSDVSEIETLYDMLDKMTGINAQGEDVDTAQMNGIINIDTITYAKYVALSARYKDITINANNIICTVKFFNESVEFNSQSVRQGSDAIDPGIPHKASTAQYYYTFNKWDKSYLNVQTDLDIYAEFDAHIQTYTFKFDPQTELVDPVPDETVDYNNLLAKPTDPYIPGAVFNGWFKESTTETEFDFSIPVTGPFVPDENDKPSPITLYGKWTDETIPNVTITVKDYNKFEFTITDNIAVDAYAITTEDVEPTEWISITPAGSYTDTYTITASGMYYVWGRDPSKQTGKASVKAYNLYKDEAPGATVVYKDNESILTNFVLQNREILVHVDLDMHYDNLHIYLNDTEIENDLSVYADKDYTTKTACTPLTYTVKFDLLGKGTAVDDQYIVYNHLVKQPQNQYDASSRCVIFGWYTEEELTNAWDFEKDRVDKDMTLYAKWVLYTDPTTITIVVDDDHKTFKCNWYQSESYGVGLSWGDGTGTSKTNGTGDKSASHTYTDNGEYEIKLTCLAGLHTLGKNFDNQAVMPISQVKKIDFAWNITYTRDYAFRGATMLPEINLTDYMTQVAVGTFRDCTAVTKLDIPNNITELKDSAFQGCTGITGVQKLSNNITTLGTQVFYGCTGITAFELPDSLSSAGSACFYRCTSVTQITIPSALTTLSDNLFSESGLTSIDIPETVTNLGVGVFAGCSSLSKVILRNKDLTMSSQVFNVCPLLKTAGPIGGDYNVEFAWTDKIPDSAFECGYNQSSFTSIIIPNSIREIGAAAFRQNGVLVDINIPVNLEKLGANAFERCEKITAIEIPFSCTYIGQNAFMYDSGITKAYFHNTSSIYTVDTPQAAWFWGAGPGKILHIPAIIDSAEKAKNVYGQCWNFYNASGEYSYINDLDL